MRSQRDERRLNVEKGLLLASMLVVAFVLAGLLDGADSSTWTGPTCDERPAPHLPIPLAEPNTLGAYTTGGNPFAHEGSEPPTPEPQDPNPVQVGGNAAKPDADGPTAGGTVERPDEEPSKGPKPESTKIEATMVRFVGWIEVEDSGRTTVVEVTGRDGYVTVEPGQLLPDTTLRVVEIVDEKITVEDEEGKRRKGRFFIETRVVPTSDVAVPLSHRETGKPSVQRQAQFADGQWYEYDPDRLAKQVGDFIGDAGDAAGAVGLMAPHAGFRYSGAIAGRGYAAVDVPGTAIVLAPAHRVPVRTAAIWSGDAWETPLGSAEIDEEVRTRLAEAFVEGEMSTSAHDGEHSLEVQLPFLKARNPDVKIVPVIVGSHDVATLEALGKACAKAIAACAHERPLIVASSDMTHFESAQTAKQKDDMALERFLAVDPDGLLDVVQLNRISMCGVAPTAAMLYAAKEIGPVQADLVAYGSSGDVTGDNTHVVAYAAATVRAADA